MIYYTVCESGDCVLVSYGGDARSPLIAIYVYILAASTYTD